MRKLTIILALAGLAACSTTQIYDNRPVGVATTAPANGVVQVLYSYPTRPYEVIGVVSAKRYKPGWTDPSVSDAIPQLQAAGAQIGANAVIVRSDRALNDRHIVVEAEAIRYTDTPAAQTP